uniref:Uncharacterized protein n=2 Tax=Kalanchoe fedtschenkoi TaxID=63787 RepID=A0A7N0VK17_KALFE
MQRSSFASKSKSAARSIAIFSQLRPCVSTSQLRMLQWMGGSRRKVATSRGSTQKRQKQYFEQRRRQQQQNTPSSANNLEENVCGTSDSERRSLDVLSLKTLSTIAQESNSRSLNAPETMDVNVAHAQDKFDIKAPQPKIPAISGNPRNGLMESTSKEETVCNSPYNSEKSLKSSNCNRDPWKTEISVLDILDDDGLKCNFIENSMHEDHVSFSVGGLGKVGTETPLNSPPHRMAHYGGSSCSNASRDVKLSKNLLNDLELEMDAVIQDIEASLSSRSSKFHCPAAIGGKRAFQINEDCKKTKYCDQPNFIVEDCLYDIQHDFPRHNRPQREYMTKDCWKSWNLQEDSLKCPQIFRERDEEIPIDSYKLSESMDPVFSAFQTSERSRYFEEVVLRIPAERENNESVNMARNPNRFDSEESCSSSAVREDKMDSTEKKSDSNTFIKILSPKVDVKRLSGEETLCGHRSYVLQGKRKNVGGTKSNNVKFDISSLTPDQPSSFTFDNKLEANNCWFVAREKSHSGIDSGLISFYKPLKTNFSGPGDELWGKGSIVNGRKSRYASHECAAPHTSFMESHDYPWRADIPLNSEVKIMPSYSFGVIESPEPYKPPVCPVSENARSGWEMKSENPFADILDCKLMKKKIDILAMSLRHKGDEEEGHSCKSDRENLKVSEEVVHSVQSCKSGEVTKSSSGTASNKCLISDGETKYQYQCEAPDSHANGIKEAKRVIADPREERSSGWKDIASPLNGVLMHQSYVVQFLCVQQVVETSVEKAKEI